MRQSDGGESPHRVVSRAPSASGSSKMRISTSDKFRKIVTKNVPTLLQKRQTMKVTDNGDDVTPKLLLHDEYDSIEEKQLTAFDTIGGSTSGSTTFLNVMSIGGGLRISVSNVVSTSTHTGFFVGDNVRMDSLLATQKGDESDLEEERAPSQFHLPR